MSSVCEMDAFFLCTDDAGDSWAVEKDGGKLHMSQMLFQWFGSVQLSRVAKTVSAVSDLLPQDNKRLCSIDTFSCANCNFSLSNIVGLPTSRTSMVSTISSKLDPAEILQYAVCRHGLSSSIWPVFIQAIHNGTNWQDDGAKMIRWGKEV